MPRGRHRHSPPLHRLLPPTAIAGASITCAAGAWLVGDALVLRTLVAAAAAAAVSGSVLMRSWDRRAGRRVAELTRARARDEWRTEERIAEIEVDLEESREVRAALEARLRAKRAELSRLRGEHAELLRRYATAETERASALEGRRLLALEAGTPAKELTSSSTGRGESGGLTPSAFAKADKALTELARNAARQQAHRTVEAARARDLAEREAEEPQGKDAAAAGSSAHARTAADSADAAAGRARPARTHHTVPAAAAVVPHTPLRRPTSRAQGGFDFFGTQSSRALPARAKRAQLTAAAPDGDLADVLGDEALAEQERHEAALTERQQPVGEVIDLTEHDETEQLDVRELRAQSS